MRIGIFAETNAAFSSVSDITFPVMAEYCSRHGYEFFPESTEKPRRSIVWHRIPRLHAGVRDFDAVVHLDADCLLTNLHIPLTEFIDRRFVATICRTVGERGGHPLNDGFFMVTRGGEPLLEKMWALERPDWGITCGQDALEHLLQWDHSVRQKVSLQPQKRFNAFLYTEYGMPASTPGHWTPGDFLLHLPGRSNERRVEIFSEHKILR